MEISAVFVLENLSMASNDLLISFGVNNEKICAIIFFIEEDENVFEYREYVEAKKAGVPIRLIRK